MKTSMRKTILIPGYSVEWAEAESGTNRRVTRLSKKSALAIAADLRANPEAEDIFVLGPDGKEIKV